ncbi:MAG: terminase family protein [Bryobacteraceae bacterium]
MGSISEANLEPPRPLYDVDAATEEDISDAVRFTRERLGFPLHELQIPILTGGRQGIMNCTRQYGKSTVAAAKAVHRAYTRPNSLILVVSPGARQSGEVLLKVDPFLTKLGIDLTGDGVNRISRRLPNGSRIVGLTSNADKLRGYSAVSMMLVDEAALVPDKLYEAMLPALATTNGDLWLMSTPNGRAGFFWKEWSEGGPEWTWIQVTAPECVTFNIKWHRAVNIIWHTLGVWPSWRG